MAAEIVALHASPRAEGNSAVFLKKALSGFRPGSVKIIRTADLRVAPCEACGWCDTRGFCRIKDDFQKVSRLMLSCRAFVAASPIYFYGLPSTFKALIDRSQCLWARKYLLKKKSARSRPAYTILVGGTGGKKLFDGVLLTLGYFYDVYNLKPSASLLVRNVDGAGDARLDAGDISRAGSLMASFRRRKTG